MWRENRFLVDRKRNLYWARRWNQTSQSTWRRLWWLACLDWVGLVESGTVCVFWRDKYHKVESCTGQNAPVLKQSAASTNFTHPLLPIPPRVLPAHRCKYLEVAGSVAFFWRPICLRSLLVVSIIARNFAIINTVTNVEPQRNLTRGVEDSFSSLPEEGSLSRCNRHPQSAPCCCIYFAFT